MTDTNHYAILPKELVDRLFQATHAAKGSGATSASDAYAVFTHEMNTFYDRVRQGTSCTTPEPSSTYFIVKDQILEFSPTSKGEAPPLLTDMIAVFCSLASGGEPATTPPKKPSPPEGASPIPTNDGESATCRISFDKGTDVVRDILIFAEDDGEVTSDNAGCGATKMRKREKSFLNEEIQPSGHWLSAQGEEVHSRESCRAEENLIFPAYHPRSNRLSPRVMAAPESVVWRTTSPGSARRYQRCGKSFPERERGFGDRQSG